MISKSAQNVAPLRIGVKYCGGCNPNYDRGELVAKIENQLSQIVLWVDPEEDPDLIIAVQGCPTACADLGSFDESKVIQLKDEEDLQSLIENLKEILGRFAFSIAEHTENIRAAIETPVHIKKNGA